MTQDVITVTEDTPAGEIAHLLETKRIKRVPVLRDGRIVGIVSRADLLRGLAAQRDAPVASATVERSEEHTSELQSLMRTSYAVFCLKKKKIQQTKHTHLEDTQQQP